MSLPDWCNIEDWGKISPDKAKFLHEQAEKVFSDAVGGYKALKARCLSLFVIKVTLISALVGYIGASMQKADFMTYPTFYAASTAIIFLSIGCFIIWRHLYGQVVPLEGQEPKRLLNKQYAEFHPLPNLYLTECFGLQGKIDELKEIKLLVAHGLWQGLFALAVAPIASLFALIIASLVV